MSDSNLLLVGQKNGYTLKVVYDEDPENPRKDVENFGTMMCWHSRYSLGDEHSYTAPDDFLRAQLFSSLCATPNVVYDFIKAGKAKNACIKHNKRTQETELYERSNRPMSDDKDAPRALIEPAVVTYPTKLEKDGSVPDWFLDNCLDLLSVGEMMAITELTDEFFILPLYLYDHSGITMNTTGFACQWDSGQVGWIYVEKDAILKNWVAEELTPELIQQAKDLMVAEVAHYDLYLRNDCYGYILEKDGEHVDSCYGFMCGYDALRSEIEEYMPEECDGITETLSAPSMAYA